MIAGFFSNPGNPDGNKTNCGEQRAMQNTSFFKLLILLSTLFLSACGMGVRGEFASMADNDLSTVQAWSRLDGDGQATILGDLIQSSDLDVLVDEALAANPGLQQTLLTLRIRQAEYRQVGGGQAAGNRGWVCDGQGEGRGHDLYGFSFHSLGGGPVEEAFGQHGGGRARTWPSSRRCTRRLGTRWRPR